MTVIYLIYDLPSSYFLLVSLCLLCAPLFLYLLNIFYKHHVKTQEQSTLSKATVNWDSSLSFSHRFLGTAFSDVIKKDQFIFPLSAFHLRVPMVGTSIRIHPIFLYSLSLLRRYLLVNIVPIISAFHHWTETGMWESLDNRDKRKSNFSPEKWQWIKACCGRSGNCTLINGLTTGKMYMRQRVALTLGAKWIAVL